MTRNVEMLEIVAEGLGELLDEVVFVGGATVTLYVTDPAAPEARPTKRCRSRVRDIVPIGVQPTRRETQGAEIRA